MSTPRATQIAPDTIVGDRYKVVRLIGKGGMGEVYEAINVNSGRKVALKMIRADVEQTPDQRRRFLREAKAATAIEHPNVIEVLDVFEDENGILVMVMELLRGESLKEHKNRRGAFTLHEIAVLMLPVVEAIHAAHEKGIVHRDLKPDNVFLAESHSGATTPRVLDFGIAKVLDPATINSETQGGATATGSLLGTPHYMSFEQAMSEKDIDQRSDVWSLGVMIFEALTGHRPIRFENLGEMYTKFLTGSVPSIRALVPDLPEDATDALDGCLKMKREERLDSLEPLIVVLNRYIDPSVDGAHAGGQVVAEADISPERVSTIGATSSASEPSASPTRSRVLVVVAATLLVGGFGGYVLLAGGGTSTHRDSATATPSSRPAPASPQATTASPLASAPPRPSALATVSATATAPTASARTPSPRVRDRTSSGASPPKASASPPPSVAKPPAQEKTGLAEELPY